MRTICVLFCIILPIMAGSLPPNEKAFLKQVHDACQADRATYCDEDILRNLHENLNHRQAGIHMLCMSKRAGLQKRNGSLDIATINAKLETVTDTKDQANKVTKACAVAKATPQITATNLWVCFVKNNAPYVHVL